MLRPIADALHHAHLSGVVHRDVKPENILLHRGGRAVLVDFGLALDPDEGKIRCAARPVVGTPLTMSPEQARGELVGPASDQFSLGTTLYHKLTGTWPFRGRTVPDVLRAIQLDAPLDPRRSNPGIPGPLSEVVLRCLEKDAAARFASMEELGSALDRALRPRVRLLRPPRTRRRRAISAAARGPRIHPEEIS